MRRICALRGIPFCTYFCCHRSPKRKFAILCLPCWPSYVVLFPRLADRAGLVRLCHLRSRELSSRYRVPFLHLFWVNYDHSIGDFWLFSSVEEGSLWRLDLRIFWDYGWSLRGASVYSGSKSNLVISASKLMELWSCGGWYSRIVEFVVLSIWIAPGSDSEKMNRNRSYGFLPDLNIDWTL